MSFDRLMEEAWNVRHTAVRKAVTRGEAHPDYARHGVEGYFDEIPELFKPFSQMPDPVAYQPIIEDLRSAMRRLSSGGQNQDPINARENYYANPNLARITTASSYLTEWDGPAAAAFKRYFLDPSPQVSRNQFILTAVCKGAMEAHQAMWHNARNDIDSVVHNALDALEKRECCDKNEWTITFTVIAAVAMVASVPLAPVTVLGATTVAGVGAAATVAAVLPPPEEKVTFHGETVHQVIGEMRRAVDKVAGDVARVEADIVKQLNLTNNTVYGNRGLFVSPRPALAEANRENIRHLLGSSE
jgi:hypothetical protein